MKWAIIQEECDDDDDEDDEDDEGEEDNNVDVEEEEDDEDVEEEEPLAHDISLNENSIPCLSSDKLIIVTTPGSKVEAESGVLGGIL